MKDYKQWAIECKSLLDKKSHIKIKWKTKDFKKCYEAGFTPTHTVDLCILYSTSL